MARTRSRSFRVLLDRLEKLVLTTSISYLSQWHDYKRPYTSLKGNRAENKFAIAYRSKIFTAVYFYTIEVVEV